MHQLGFVLLTYLAAVLHVGTSAPDGAGLHLRPHFLLLVVFTAVLYFEDWTALIWAAFAGLVSDCLSPGPWGVEMAAFATAAFLMHHQLRRHSSPGVLRASLVCFVVGLAALGVSHTVRLLILSHPFDHAQLVLLIGSTAAATAGYVAAFRLVQSLLRRAFLGSHRRAATSY